MFRSKMLQIAHIDKYLVVRGYKYTSGYSTLHDEWYKVLDGDCDCLIYH